MRDGKVARNGRNIIVRATTPTVADDGLQVGDLWSDTFSETLKYCTNASTPTFVAISSIGDDAPNDATFIVQTPSSSLTSEQALSTLGTGVVYNTTGTGVLSIKSIGTDIQAYDADLDGLSALSSTGYVVRTAADTYTNRTITGNLGSVFVTNGNGVSGNTLISLAQDLGITSSPSFHSLTLTGNPIISQNAVLSTGAQVASNIEFKAWNEGSFTYSTYITLTSANPNSSCDLSDSVTKNGQYIYRAAGTDVPITDGGTGASTAVAAFNNLSPVTTQGDMIYRDSTNNARLAIGTAGQVLAVNASATAPEWINTPTWLTVTSNVTSTSTTFASVTGLVFTAATNTKYIMQFVLAFETASSLTGIKFGIFAPSGSTVTCRTEIPLTDVQSVMSVTYEEANASDTGTATATATAVRHIAVVYGTVTTGGTGGNIACRFASETGGSQVTVLTPSWGYYMKVA